MTENRQKVGRIFVFFIPFAWCEYCLAFFGSLEEGVLVMVFMVRYDDHNFWSCILSLSLSWHRRQGSLAVILGCHFQSAGVI